MKRSAGILLFRRHTAIEFLLVHPGGPFFAKKDLGSWSIPKGEYENDEEPLHAAIREFREETGTELTGNFIDLGEIRQKAGKIVHAWALESDLDPATIISNQFEIEWPPKSGRLKSFPEVDRAGWFDAITAAEKINPAQATFINTLLEALGLA